LLLDNKIFFLAGAKDLAAKTDKTGKYYRTAFMEYTSRVFTISEASNN
jgi:hypothetical protein